MKRSCWFVGAIALAGCSNGGDASASGAGGQGSGSGAGSSASATPSGAGGSGGDASASGGAGSGSGGAGGSGPHCVSANGGSSASGGSGGNAGTGGDACHGAGARFATEVVEVCYGADAGFGQEDFPGIVYGPPKGAGDGAGSLDVLSLGKGGSITIGFSGNAIVDGPGPDFIVFENPFEIGGNPHQIYANPGTVAVSDDGQHWVSFPCTATAYPWGSCAGWHPVLANADDNDIDPLDPKKAGGDAFDLSDIGVARARFVRITDRPDLPGDFDLDAVGIVNAACP